VSVAPQEIYVLKKIIISLSLSPSLSYIISIIKRYVRRAEESLNGGSGREIGEQKLREEHV
jgi:hypothetical protein